MDRIAALAGGTNQQPVPRLSRIMSTKRSRRTPSASTGKGSPPCAEVERLFQKERFKDAVKQAKLCYKEEATPANHSLLERAYFLRARQLLQLGMRASAVEVAQHLLDFGVTASDWVDEFVRLLISLGLAEDAFQIQERLGAPELKEQLATIAADQAVSRSRAGIPDVSRGGSRCEPDSSSRLRGYKPTTKPGRSCCCAIWREARCSVNGNSSSAAWPLTIGTTPGKPRPTGAASTPGERRSRSQSGCAGLTGRSHRTPTTSSSSGSRCWYSESRCSRRLRQANNLAADQDWDKLCHLLGPLSVSLRRIDPKLAERLTGALFGPLIKEVRSRDPDRRHRPARPIHQGGRADVDRPPLEPPLGHRLGWATLRCGSLTRPVGRLYRRPEDDSRCSVLGARAGAGDDLEPPRQDVARGGRCV